MFFVDWSEQTCQEIDRQYRALHEIVYILIQNSLTNELYLCINRLVHKETIEDSFERKQCQTSRYGRVECDYG